ncbi:MAG: Long-chain-fatty-acid--CoA ligase [Blastococcus sp.]|jgi:acyl-CoA synthetase (AMP-forming)/AMP-acid ligase II|nr:Long-chain-fatty-acid--CoA ligase [Blastococcus sp.]
MAIDVERLYDRRADNRWDRTCVGDVLERLTWSRPDRVALTGWAGAYATPEFERLTYRQANEVVNRVANGLLSAGLQRGDRVLLVCENSVEAYVFKLGVAKAGMVNVPLNPALAPDVMTQLIDLVEPRFSIVDAELWAGVAPAFEESGLRPDVTIGIGGGPVATSASFPDFLAGQPADEPDTVVHGDDIWEILFTSGTTALPKGVMLSHSYAHMAAYSFALSLTRGVAIEADLVQCSFLPVIYHVADQILSLPAFLAGGRLVIGRRPSPDEMAAAIEREQVTAMWGGSPQLVKALAASMEAQSGTDRSSLRVLVYGWGAVEPGVLATLESRCGPDFTLVGIFGQTEAISCHRFWPSAERSKYEAAGSSVNYVGIPNPLLASTVLDFDGSDLLGTPGVPGEAVYRSPAVTAGYYRDLSATEEAFRYGWFHSGDSCVVDEDGLRIMVDRYKDIIKSGGENVSSIRVEAMLHEHPEVTKAAVIGLPHERWGEAVTAVVVRTPGAAVTEQELVDWARSRLAGFETPKAVLFADALPETVGGKVLKYKLRQAMADLYEAGASDPAASGSR